jgi:hypothetical protein
MAAYMCSPSVAQREAFALQPRSLNPGSRAAAQHSGGFSFVAVSFADAHHVAIVGALPLCNQASRRAFAWIDHLGRNVATCEGDMAQSLSGIYLVDILQLNFWAAVPTGLEAVTFGLGNSGLKLLARLRTAPERSAQPLPNLLRFLGTVHGMFRHDEARTEKS